MTDTIKGTIKDTEEYKTIAKFYGDRKSARSEQPLIKHIDEGLIMLDAMQSSDTAKRAFCLHPIVQNNEDVDVSWSSAYSLACEYRDRANSYLCRPETDHFTLDDIIDIVGPMSEDCIDMLMADKVQNSVDLHKYHQGHERYEKLSQYFKNWIRYLLVAENT